MKNGFESQFESLIRPRFQDRDTRFMACLVKVKQEHNSRGLLTSSTTVVAMHAELEREFKESANECVKAAVELMASQSTASFWASRKQRVQRACAEAISKRRGALEGIFHGAAASVLNSLRNSSLTAPYRSLSDSFVELQRKNAFMELTAKRREFFWLKVKRLLKVLPLVAAVLALVSYLGREEIVGVWEGLRDRNAGSTLDTGEPADESGVTGTTVGASRVLVASHCPPTDRLEPDSSFSVLRLFRPKSTGLHCGKVNLVRSNGAM